MREEERIMQENWNRMSFLSGFRKRNVKAQAEYEARMSFQNIYSRVKTKKDREEVINTIKECFKKERR